MRIEQVTTLEGALTAVHIRNTVAEFMTRDQSIISDELQSIWWSIAKDDPNIILYLALLEDATPIGYGLLKCASDGRYWGTLAVLKEYHNQGYGTAIYQFLAAQVPELYIEIFSDNIASMRSAIKAGFTMEYAGDKTIIFSTRNMQQEY